MGTRIHLLAGDSRFDSDHTQPRSKGSAVSRRLVPSDRPLPTPGIIEIREPDADDVPSRVLTFDLDSIAAILIAGRTFELSATPKYLTDVYLGVPGIRVGISLESPEGYLWF